MTTKQDFLTISKIADRAIALGYPSDKLSTMMDLEYANDDIPMNLDALLAADDGNFAHDVFGIYRHFDRANKRFVGCFCPRYAIG